MVVAAWQGDDDPDVHVIAEEIGVSVLELEHEVVPAIVEQTVGLVEGGVLGLADAERLNDEPLVRPLARVAKFADQTQLGQWLRKQNATFVAAFGQFSAQFVQWVLARADPARWTDAGRAEAFLDDPQIEVLGPSFEGAPINYHGERACSGPTLWLGPFLVGGELGAPGDVGGALPTMPQQRHGRWNERAGDCLADRGSSRADYLQAIDPAGFTHGSVSYNQWTRVPERTAAARA